MVFLSFLSSSLAHFSCFTTCLYRITFRISALALSLLTFLCYNKKIQAFPSYPQQSPMIDEEVPDVKHHRSLFRALSALLCLVLCTQLTACGQKDTFSPASGKRYDDSLITEAISKEGSFTDEHCQEWDYSYHPSFLHFSPLQHLLQMHWQSLL